MIFHNFFKIRTIRDYKTMSVAPFNDGCKSFVKMSFIMLLKLFIISIQHSKII